MSTDKPRPEQSETEQRLPTAEALSQRVNELMEEYPDHVFESTLLGREMMMVQDGSGDLLLLERETVDFPPVTEKTSVYPIEDGKPLYAIRTLDGRFAPLESHMDMRGILAGALKEAGDNILERLDGADEAPLTSKVVQMLISHVDAQAAERFRQNIEGEGWT